MHGAQILVEDDASRQEQIAGLIAALAGCHGKVPIGHIVAQPTANSRPVLVEGSHRQQVGDMDPLDKVPGFGKELLYQRQLGGVDGILAIGIHRAGHAAHQVGLGVGILGPKDGLDADHVPLPVQRLQVVGHRHQIGLRRQLVGWMAPVPVGKDAQLPALGKSVQPVLDTAEIGRAR